MTYEYDHLPTIPWDIELTPEQTEALARVAKEMSLSTGDDEKVVFGNLLDFIRSNREPLSRDVARVVNAELKRLRKNAKRLNSKGAK